MAHVLNELASAIPRQQVSNIPGTGLGLSMVKQLVPLQQGTTSTVSLLTWWVY
ncbi:MAG: hypothetical protein AAFW95_14880 [Cyanobacteria bacterium J06638_6]